jgi:NADPH:quinone reductase-like Zn-dependent oxidoreductase
MKAAILTGHGGNEVVDYCDFPRPEPKPGNVLVKMKAAALNRVDLYMRDSGAGIRHELPMVMGIDGAGVVEEAHASSGFQKGDPVIIYPDEHCGQCRYCQAGEQAFCLKVAILGEHRHGTLGEYLSISASCLLPKPESLSFDEAACLPVAYLTAWRMIFTRAQVRPGQTVLIHGVGGGVSLAALQLCKMAGAHVIVTSSSDEKLARAKTMGADQGINYTRDPVAKTVLAATDRLGVDVVIENVGNSTWDDSLRSVSRGGKVVVCGATTGGDAPADLQRVFVRQIQILGSTLGNMMELRQLIQAVAQNKIKPVIDRTFTLDQIHMALDAMDKGQQFGKIIIRH